MKTTEFKPLTTENVNSLVGKTIEWQAEGNQKSYKGKFKIEKSSEVKPFIEGVCLQGDDLSQAFLDDHGLEEIEDGYKAILNTSKCFSFSDGYREVFFREWNSEITKTKIVRVEKVESIPFSLRNAYQPIVSSVCETILAPKKKVSMIDRLKIYINICIFDRVIIEGSREELNSFEKGELLYSCTVVDDIPVFGLSDEQVDELNNTGIYTRNNVRSGRVLAIFDDGVLYICCHHPIIDEKIY